MAEAAAQVDKVIVAEMNLGQMIGEVERATAGRAEGPCQGLQQATIVRCDLCEK